MRVEAGSASAPPCAVRPRESSCVPCVVLRRATDESRPVLLSCEAGAKSCVANLVVAAACTGLKVEAASSAGFHVGRVEFLEHYGPAYPLQCHFDRRCASDFRDPRELRTVQ
eukprot:1820264-Prymnesium_polylepis.8